MVDKEIIHEWVSKAEEDFRFALVNLEEGKPFFAQICFHFQQSAEKFLKAYIIAHGLEFRRIHDLSALLKICESHDSSFKDLRLDVEFLNAYYVDMRYPVHWPTRYSQEEAEKARASAQRIRSLVRQKLDFQ
jgi:HEPN domain-containing protein